MDSESGLILIVSNTNDTTVDFFEEKLGAGGVQHLRLDTNQIPSESIELHVDEADDAFVTTVSGIDVRPDDVTAVYYRRPVAPNVSTTLPADVARWAATEFRQAWGAFLATVSPERWMNHPAALTNASYKPEQLKRAKSMGLRVPRTLVTTSPESALSFCRALDWNVIVKPVGHGALISSSGDTSAIVFTTRIGPEKRESLELVRHCPTLFQERIAKEADLRVTMAGRDAVTVVLHSQERAESSVDCRRDNMANMRYSLRPLPAQVQQNLGALLASYGLRYGAIDLVEDDDGRIWFLELNAAGQWAWLEQEAEAPISSMIIENLTAPLS